VIVIREPIEPPSSKYRLPDPRQAPAHGLLGTGADLAPGTVLAAYRSGVFPWPDDEGHLLWWSPDPRAIIPLDAFHESRRLRRTRRTGLLRLTRDTACAAVIDGCATAHGATWITPDMQVAYEELHRLGWVHSVEVWSEGQLVGGLYGVAVGGFFAAESMFHRVRDASKVALAGLADHLRTSDFALLDVQLLTPHLASFGATEISRGEYLGRLEAALVLPARW